MDKSKTERIKSLLREILAMLDDDSKDDMSHVDEHVKSLFKDEPKPSRSKRAYKLRFDIELEDYIIDDDDAV